MSLLRDNPNNEIFGPVSAGNKCLEEGSPYFLQDTMESWREDVVPVAPYGPRDIEEEDYTPPRIDCDDGSPDVHEQMLEEKPKLVGSVCGGPGTRADKGSEDCCSSSKIRAQNLARGRLIIWQLMESCRFLGTEPDTSEAELRRKEVSLRLILCDIHKLTPLEMPAGWYSKSGRSVKLTKVTVRWMKGGKGVIGNNRREKIVRDKKCRLRRLVARARNGSHLFRPPSTDKSEKNVMTHHHSRRLFQTEARITRTGRKCTIAFHYGNPTEGRKCGSVCNYIGGVYSGLARLRTKTGLKLGCVHHISPSSLPKDSEVLSADWKPMGDVEPKAADESRDWRAERPDPRGTEKHWLDEKMERISQKEKAPTSLASWKMNIKLFEECIGNPIGLDSEGRWSHKPSADSDDYKSVLKVKDVLTIDLADDIMPHISLDMVRVRFLTDTNNLSYQMMWNMPEKTRIALKATILRLGLLYLQRQVRGELFESVDELFEDGEEWLKQILQFLKTDYCNNVGLFMNTSFNLIMKSFMPYWCSSSNPVLIRIQDRVMSILINPSQTLISRATMIVLETVKKAKFNFFPLCNHDEEGLDLLSEEMLSRLSKQIKIMDSHSYSEEELDQIGPALRNPVSSGNQILLSKVADEEVYDQMGQADDVSELDPLTQFILKEKRTENQLKEATRLCLVRLGVEDAVTYNRRGGRVTHVGMLARLKLEVERIRAVARAKIQNQVNLGKYELITTSVIEFANNKLKKGTSEESDKQKRILLELLYAAYERCYNEKQKNALMKLKDSVESIVSTNTNALWQVAVLLKGYTAECFFSEMSGKEMRLESEKPTLLEALEEAGVQDLDKLLKNCSEARFLKPDDIDLDRDKEGKVIRVSIIEYGWVTDTEGKRESEFLKWERVKKALNYGGLTVQIYVKLLSNDKNDWSFYEDNHNKLCSAWMCYIRDNLRNVFHALTLGDQDKSSFFIEGIASTKLRKLQERRQKYTYLPKNEVEDLKERILDMWKENTPEMAHEDLEAWMHLTGRFKEFGKGLPLLSDAMLKEIIEEVEASSIQDPFMDADSESAKVLIKSWKEDDNPRNGSTRRFQPELDVICQLPLPADFLEDSQSGSTDLEKLIHIRLPFQSGLVNEIRPVNTSDRKLNSLNKEYLGIKRLLSLVESLSKGERLTLGKRGKIKVLDLTTKTTTRQALLQELPQITGLNTEKKAELRTMLKKNGRSEEISNAIIMMSKKVQLKLNTQMEDWLCNNLDEPILIGYDNVSMVVMACLEKMDVFWRKTLEERIQILDQRRSMNSEKRKVKVDSYVYVPDAESERATYSFVNKLAEPHNMVALNELPQDVFSLELMHYLIEKSPVCNRIGIQFLLMCLQSSTKFPGFKYSILAHEVGAAVIDCLVQNNSSGNTYLKFLKFSKLNLIVNYPRPAKENEEVLTCMLYGEGTEYIKSANGVPEPDSEYSHKFYMTKSLARQYEASVSITLQFLMLILQYEGWYVDNQKTEECMRQVWSWAALLSLGNNRAMNELTQNYRYIAMAFMGDFLDPVQLGRKMAVPIRTTFNYLVRRKVMKATKKWGKWRQDVESVEQMIESGEHPNFPSLFFNIGLSSPKSLITEIYIEHNFEKETVPRARNLEKVFDKSYKAWRKFTDHLSNGDMFVLGLGENTVSRVLRNDGKSSGMSLEMCHDAGLLLYERLHLTSSHKSKIELAKVNVGLSDLTNTTSIVEKKIFKYDTVSARKAIRKKKILRFSRGVIGHKGRGKKEQFRKVKEALNKRMGPLRDPEEVDLVENAVLSRNKFLASDKALPEVFVFNSDRTSAPDVLAATISYIKKFGKINKKKKGEESQERRNSGAEAGPADSSYQVCFVELKRICQLSRETKTRDDMLFQCLEAETFNDVEIMKQVLEECRITDLTLETADCCDLESINPTLKKLVDKKQQSMANPEINMDDELEELACQVQKQLESPKMMNSLILITALVSAITPKLHFDSYRPDDDMEWLSKHFQISQEACQVLLLKILCDQLMGIPFKDVCLSRGEVVCNSPLKGNGPSALLIAAMSLSLSMDPVTTYSALSGKLSTMRDMPLGRQMRMDVRTGKSWEVPRSSRNKVILALIDLALARKGDMDGFSTSIQTISEEMILRKDHDFFGMANKVQLGGPRELGIQDMETKITNHVSETYSRTVNRGITSQDLTEGLSHPKAKYYCVEDSSDVVLATNGKDNKIAVVANKDHSKWGPNHCPGFNFRATILGCRKLFEDKFDFMDVKMLRGSCKWVEIPSDIAIKLLDEDYVTEINAETDDIKENFVDKGKANIFKINDMIQGIHHHTSSLTAMAAQVMLKKCLKLWVESKWPELDCQLRVIQGSDDELGTLIIEGPNWTRTELLNIAKRIWSFERKFLLLFNMCTSPKSTYGRIAIEYNSNFVVLKANTVATFKYLSSQMQAQKVFDLLDSVSSTYSQCQQAVTQGSPFSNILLLWWKRQSYDQHSFHTLSIPLCREERLKPDDNDPVLEITKMVQFEFSLDRPFLKGYTWAVGRNKLEGQRNLPYHFGGLFCPTVSNLLSNNLSHIEAQQVSETVNRDHGQSWVLLVSKGLESESEIIDRTRRFKTESLFNPDFKSPLVGKISDAKKKAKVLIPELDNDRLVDTTAKGRILKFLMARTQPSNSYIDFERLKKILSSRRIEYSLAETDLKNALNHFNCLAKAAFYGTQRNAVGKTFQAYVRELQDHASIMEDVLSVRREQLTKIANQVRQARETMFKSMEKAENSVTEFYKYKPTDVHGRCRVSVTEAESVLHNKPEDILMHRFNPEDPTCLPPEFEWNYARSDKLLMELICRDQIEALDEINLTNGEEPVERHLESIISIMGLYTQRPTDIFGPGTRDSLDTVFVSNLLRRNVVAGLSTDLVVDNFGQANPGTQLMYSDCVGVLSLIFKLCPSDIRNGVLRTVYTRPLYNHTSLRESLTRLEKTFREVSVTMFDRVLLLKSCFFDSDASMELRRRIKIVEPTVQIVRLENQTIIKYTKAMMYADIRICGGKSIIWVNTDNLQFLKSTIGALNNFIGESVRWNYLAFDPEIVNSVITPDEIPLSTLRRRYESTLERLKRGEMSILYYFVNEDSELTFTENPPYEDSGRIYIDRSLTPLDSSLKVRGSEINIEHTTSNDGTSIMYTTSMEAVEKEKYLNRLTRTIIGMSMLEQDTGIDLQEFNTFLEERRKRMVREQHQSMVYSRVIWPDNVSRTAVEIFLKMTEFCKDRLERLKTDFDKEILLRSKQRSGACKARDDSSSQASISSYSSLTEQEAEFSEKLKRMTKSISKQKDYDSQEKMVLAMKVLVDRRSDEMQDRTIKELYSYIHSIQSVDVQGTLDIPDTEDVNTLCSWERFLRMGGIESDTLFSYRVEQISFGMRFRGLSSWIMFILAMAMNKFGANRMFLKAMLHIDNLETKLRNLREQGPRMVPYIYAETDDSGSKSHTRSMSEGSGGTDGEESNEDIEGEGEEGQPDSLESLDAEEDEEWDLVTAFDFELEDQEDYNSAEGIPIITDTDLLTMYTPGGRSQKIEYMRLLSYSLCLLETIWEGSSANPLVMDHRGLKQLTVNKTYRYSPKGKLEGAFIITFSMGSRCLEKFHFREQFLALERKGIVEFDYSKDTKQKRRKGGKTKSVQFRVSMQRPTDEISSIKRDSLDPLDFTDSFDLLLLLGEVVEG